MAKTIEAYGMLLPAKRIVCPRCDGEGVHDNEAFSNGLTASDLEDPDFRESYLRGTYDVRCSECKGLRVIDDVDEDQCTEEQLKEIQEWKESEAESRAIEAAERRWGA